MNQIKVLVVDDSKLYREIIKSGIEKDEAITVIAEASDAVEARNMIAKHHPDVVTLDVEMPGMNGVEFLKKILPQFPVPVVMVSSISEAVVDALGAGAVDYVVKPDNMTLDWFYYELILKIKIASVAKVKNNVPVLFPQRTSELRAGTCNIIAIGASTGGTEAIFDIICKLPRNSPGIVIVQHMPPVFTGMYAERLNKSCELEVIEAKKGDVVYPGRVLIAPGGFMMRLIYKNGIYSVDCFEADKVNGHIPSVDVLFESTAKAAKEKAIGVLLTGMGSDGAKGLLAMKQAGAFTIGQDEASCVVYGMPKVAYELGAVELQVPLKNIAQVIIETLAM